MKHQKEQEKLQDLDCIKQWAQAKQPGEYLGQTCSMNDCPIARYLLDQTSIPWSVCSTLNPLSGSDDWQEQALTRELDDLLVRVDTLYRDEMRNLLRGTVTREQFLTILTDIREKEKDTP